jgi:murein DD-endopeptidase MepM/ murein hydrolase activator NlpD
VRAVLSSMAMVLAMVKAPGDAVPDDAGVRLLGPDQPLGELVPPAPPTRASRARDRDRSGDGESGGSGDDAPRTTFPIDGSHTYGDGFGDRPNHRGQDLLAACGTPLRATSDAKVRLVDEEASAGRHIVMRTASGRDLVYMHMSDVDVGSGERVTAGERVGSVGRTGNASTCHLHFETWGAPGWYAGGEPRDPATLLRSKERAPVKEAP